MDDKHLEDDEKSAVDDFHDVLDKQTDGEAKEVALEKRKTSKRIQSS